MMLTKRVEKLESIVIDHETRIKSIEIKIINYLKNISSKLDFKNDKIDELIKKKTTWFDKISYILSGGFILMLISVIFYS